MNNVKIKIEGGGTKNQVASRLRDLARAIDDAGENGVDLKQANLDNDDGILYIEVDCDF